MDRLLRHHAPAPLVADYCLTDVLATYCVFLRYEMVAAI
jgi:hypothetical protein